MEGRWQHWLAGGILFALAGCSRNHVPPPPPGPMLNPPAIGTPAPLSRPPVVEDSRDRGNQPLKVETLVTLGNVRAAAAQDATRSPQEKQQLLEQARQAFQQAIQREPKCFDAYHGLAMTYRQQGERAKAMETYRAAAQAMPNEGKIYYEMARCARHFGDWEAAIENLHMAAKVNPENPVYQTHLGFTLAMNGRYEEGFAWLHKTMGEAKARYNLAGVLAYQNKGDDARVQLELALKADPSYTPARDYLAYMTNKSSDNPHLPETDRSSGIKTVGHEEWAPIPPERLAPNARLLGTDRELPPTTPPSNKSTQPSSMPGNPSGTYTPLSQEAQPVQQLPAAAIQTPEPAPLTMTRSNAPPAIPRMLPTSGGER